MAKSFRDKDVTALPCLSTTPTFTCTSDVSVVIISSGCWASTPAATSSSTANDRNRVVRRTRFETEAETENEFIPSLTTKNGYWGNWSMPVPRFGLQPAVGRSLPVLKSGTLPPAMWSRDFTIDEACTCRQRQWILASLLWRKISVPRSHGRILDAAHFHLDLTKATVAGLLRRIVPQAVLRA